MKSSGLPDVVPFAVGFPIPDKARAALVQVLTALRAFQTGRVPLQVRGHAQDVLVVDLVPTAHTQGDQALFWGGESTSMRLLGY